MVDITKHISLMAEYSRYFYNTNSGYIPYQNTLAVTPVVEFKPVSLSVNYSYYFGDQSAHRLMPGLTGTFSWKNVWVLDRLSVMPSAYLLWGNEIIHHPGICRAQNAGRAPGQPQKVRHTAIACNRPTGRCMAS